MLRTTFSSLLVGLLTLTALEQGGVHTQPGSFEPHLLLGVVEQRHNLDMLNRYRAQVGVAPLRLDAQLNNFALVGSQELMRDHIPHKHFRDSGLAGSETQGDPNGWPIVGWPSAPNVNATIDQILAAMMAEPLPPPGGLNHHSIIIDPALVNVGVGLVVDGANGKLYFTNDFTQ
jgi:uncharacterized protein YkwD